MSKLMPLSDFRARRRVLMRRDFGYAPRPAPPPSDLIDKATWNSIVTLPDDVGVRTSNYHGTTIKQLDDLWRAWIECVGEKQDCIFPVMLDAGDDFQAARRRRGDHSRIDPAFRPHRKDLGESERDRLDQRRAGVLRCSDHWSLPDKTRVLSRTIIRRTAPGLDSCGAGSPSRSPETSCW